MFLRSLIVFLLLGLLIAGLAWMKYSQIQAQIAMFSHPMPPTPVTAATVTAGRWQPRLSAVGTVQAGQGVLVNNQVAGQVERILFESGDQVKAGQPLVQLDTAVDEADLAGLNASQALAKTQLARNQQLLKTRAVSQGDFDEISARLEEITAQVQAKQALVEQKTIRAPFAGLLGIRLVNLGQYLEAGSAIVALEARDPVFVDFTLPERRLADLAVGQPVEVRLAAYSGRVFTGQVQAVSPALDRATRNVVVRARIDNREGLLRSGMFAKVAALLPEQAQVLTLPRTAITFNTYGDSVFSIVPGEGELAGQLTVQRRQVQTGAVRDQRVEVSDGLALGDQVVATGQLRLRNGMEVVVVPEQDGGDGAAPAQPESAP